MTYLGTRPPTVDEWEKYELHHRSRMSTKPGITGMWQVSGRSDITDEEMEMDYRKEYERWMKQAAMDEDIVEELRSMDDAKMEDAFYRDLAFGTGGLRGVIGAGTNRINIYTIAKASQGLADYLKKNFEEPSVAIGYDSRIK